MLSIFYKKDLNFSILFKLSVSYEVLHIIHVALSLGILSNLFADQYTYFICTATLLGKFFDFGFGAASPHLFKTIPYLNLIQTYLQQMFLVIVPVVIGFSCFAKVNSLFFAVLFFGFCEAIMSPCRHLSHMTQNNVLFSRLEIFSKFIQIIIFIGIFFIASPSKAFVISIITTCFMASVTTILALKITIKSCFQFLNLKKVLSSFKAIIEKESHKKTFSLRAQVFTTKMGSLALSVCVITPLYAYSYGIEYMWLFFFLTSLIVSIQNIVKTVIGYNATRVFSRFQFHEISKIDKTLQSFNFLLTIIITTTISVSTGAFIIAQTLNFFSPEVLKSLGCVACYAVFVLTDLLSIVYEQLFLLFGMYKEFQKIRVLEYALFSCVGIILTPFVPLWLLTLIFIFLKLSSLFIFIRTKANNIFFNPSSSSPSFPLIF